MREGPTKLHGLRGGLTEDPRIEPAPCIILDEVGVAVLIWDESYRHEPESREAANGRQQEKDGVPHGSMLCQFRINKEIVPGCRGVVSIVIGVEELCGSHQGLGEDGGYVILEMVR